MPYVAAQFKAVKKLVYFLGSGASSFKYLVPGALVLLAAAMQVSFQTF